MLCGYMKNGSQPYSFLGFSYLWAMEIEIGKNNKTFKIIDNQEVVIKGVRPKWYSSNIQFFHNSKTYELKKKGFWGTSFSILQGGQLFGDIVWSFKTGAKIILKDSDLNTSHYSLKAETVGKWYSSNRQYILNKNEKTTALTIHYALKKWKESIEAEFNDKSNADYVLLVAALFLMRRQQSAEGAGAAGAMAG